MTAYFSSKFSKHIYAAFTAALLVFCLLGTHWIGYSHSISHAQLQSHTELDPNPGNKHSSLSHSSDVCHLFDALTLAGFAISKPLANAAFSFIAFVPPSSDTALLAQSAIEHYQSRAPPTLLL